VFPVFWRAGAAFHGGGPSLWRPPCPPGSVPGSGRLRIEKPAHGIGRVVDGAANAQLHLAAGEFINNVLRIAQRPGQAVEFGHDQGISGPAGGQRFPESRPCPVGTGQALICERLPRRHPQSGQGILLCGEILVVGGYAGVSFAVWPCLAGAFVCFLYGLYSLLRLVSRVRFVP
jgi:hypothetical protein